MYYKYIVIIRHISVHVAKYEAKSYIYSYQTLKDFIYLRANKKLKNNY